MEVIRIRRGVHIMKYEVGHCIKCCKRMNEMDHDLCNPIRPDVIHEPEDRCHNYVGVEGHK